MVILSKTQIKEMQKLTPFTDVTDLFLLVKLHKRF